MVQGSGDIVSQVIEKSKESFAGLDSKLVKVKSIDDKPKSDSLKSAKKNTKNSAKKNTKELPIVMLRGLGRGKHHWASFKTEMTKAFPNRDILFIDLPGNGELSHLKSPNNIKAAAEAITTQLELEGVDGPCDFVGLSLGGMLVLYMMENTSWVRRATVINTSLGSLSYPLERIKPMALLSLVYSLMLPKPQQEKMIWKVTAKQPMDKAVLKNWINVSKLHHVSPKNLWSQLMIARSYNKKPILGKKEKDLLVLSSRKDELVSSRCSKKLAQHTGALHKVHKTAGHDLPLDDPKWVASCVHQFFSCEES